MSDDGIHFVENSDDNGKFGQRPVQSMGPLGATEEKGQKIQEGQKPQKSVIPVLPAPPPPPPPPVKK